MAVQTEGAESTSAKTYSSDLGGPQEAAADLADRRRTDDEPVEVGDLPDVPDPVDIRAENKGLRAKDAAEGLSKWRAEETKRRAEYNKAIFGDLDGSPPSEPTEQPQAAPSNESPEAATAGGSVEPTSPSYEDVVAKTTQSLREVQEYKAKVADEVGAFQHLLSQQFAAAFPDERSQEDLARMAMQEPQRHAVFIGAIQEAQEAINELRSRGYQNALCVLPHDGVNANNITGKRYEDHVSDAGFRTEIIKNQGAGAAAMRIEAVRRALPKCWFDETKTKAGREALGYYHEKKDENRDVGLGPSHDWSSHGADSFGLMAIHYEEPSRMKSFRRPINYPRIGIV